MAGPQLLRRRCRGREAGCGGTTRTASLCTTAPRAEWRCAPGPAGLAECPARRSECTLHQRTLAVPGATSRTECVRSTPPPPPLSSPLFWSQVILARHCWLLQSDRRPNTAALCVLAVRQAGLRASTVPLPWFAPVPRWRQQVSEATDPYSVALAADGARSQFADLGDAATQPPGWGGHAAPALLSLMDVSLYELHIRDFRCSPHPHK